VAEVLGVSCKDKEKDESMKSSAGYLSVQCIVGSMFLVKKNCFSLLSSLFLITFAEKNSLVK
jgi:hypothetical protein